MESVLKSQLKQLKANQKNAPVLPRNAEASFLFDFHTSKRVDVDTIYELGYSGLIELSRHNNNFVKYFESLLNNTSKYFNRDVKKDEELKLIDASLNELLFELIPYFTYKSSHRLLEYLIKIFNVNIYNSKRLFLSFLPYHESKLFLKLIQNINFENLNNFIFVVPYVKSGAVLLKENLYKEISSNYNFLKEILIFYEEMTGLTEIDDSIYINFICEIFEYIIKTSTRGVEINILTLALQFINKCFKYYGSKQANVIYKNDDYEEIVVSCLTNLIIRLVDKVKLNQEYTKAIFNDLIIKMLPNLKNEDSIDDIIKTVFIICEDLNNKNSSGFKEESINLILAGESSRISKSIKKLADTFDIFTLIKSIFFSKNNPKNLILMKELLKNNDVKSFDKLILFLLEYVCNDENIITDEKKEEVLHLLSFIDQMSSHVFNNVLINIFTNKNKLYDQQYVNKVKNFTSEVNQFYYKALNSNHMNDGEDINAFNLFINMNSTNISIVIHSISKIEELIEENMEALSYSVPFLANKFTSNDKELILTHILDLKCFKTIINNFTFFKKEFIEFYLNLKIKGIKMYTKLFVEKVEDIVINFCCSDDNNEYNLKLLITFLFLRDEKIDKNRAISLLQDNPYLNKILQDKNNSFDESIINYLCSHQDNLNSLNFIKDLKKILQLAYEENTNLDKIEIDKNELIKYVKCIMHKEAEKLDLIKNIVTEELDNIIEILKIKHLDQYLFEQMSNICVENLSNSNLINSVFEISNLFINNSKLDVLDNFLKSYFKGNFSHIQVFLANLILLKDITDPKLFAYLKTLKISIEEVTLLVSILYSILNSQIDSSLLLSSLDSSDCNNLKEGFENFNIIYKPNSICNSKQKNSKKIDISGILRLKEEILTRKNEILINKNYLKNFISSKSDANIFFIINEIFINNLQINSENIKAILKILSLFTPTTKNQISKNEMLFKEELRNLYKNLIKEFSPNSFDMQTKDNFYKLLENLFMAYLNIFPRSSVDILKLILDHQKKLIFNPGLFMNSLFSIEHFNMDDLKVNMDLNFHVIKYAVKHSVSSDIFMLNEENYSLNLIDYIIDKKIILKEEELFTISYIFEIIIKNNNSYFNMKFVNKVLSILTHLRIEFNKILENNSFYINLTNNLLTIVSNCTVETEEIDSLKLAIKEIETNIFYLIEKFKYSGLDSSSSLEIVHIVNSLFLCLNKLISQLTNIEEERQIVKNVIINCFNILNSESSNSLQLSKQVKEEVYIIFINAVRNFIELLFINHNRYLKKNAEQYEIFFEYIHQFVKFTFTLMNFKDKNIIEHLLTNFIKIEIIKTNPQFLACFFTNVYYYNLSISQSYNENFKDSYSEVIFKFFNKQNDAEFTQLGIDVILSILLKLNNSNNNIFFIDNNLTADPFIISLSLINKILVLIENSFFNLSDMSNARPAHQTLLEICENIYLCRKNISKKMRDSNKNEYTFQLNELKNFEENLFADMNDSNLLNEVVLLIYQSEDQISNKQYSKQTRNYMLSNYLDILITNNKANNLDRVFDYFINVIKQFNEDRIENLQLIFSILTKVVDSDKNKLLNIQKNDSVNVLLILIDLSEEKNKNINYLFYQISLIVFISKMFVSYGNKLLDKFNIFMERMLNCVDIIINLKNEEKSTISTINNLMLETFENLTSKQSEYMSPFLKKAVFKILLILNNNLENDSIKMVAKRTLENLSSGQLLDASLKTVKFCLKNMNKMNLFEKDTPIEYLMNFLKISISKSDKIMIAGVYDKLLKLFIKLLLNEQVKSNPAVESILSCLRTFILKINEKQLKLMFSDILKFAKEPGEGENGFKYRLENCIVALQLFNSILKAISIIFVPYFEKYKNFWTDLILYTNTIFSSEDKRDSGKKKSRASYDTAYNDEENKFSYLHLNTLLLENTRLNFINNTDGQLLNETIEDLTESLVGQLKFIFFENEEDKLMNYYNDQIKTTFVEIFKNLKSEDIFKEFNDNILNLIREDHYLIKLLTLKMIKSLFEELKERYVMLLNDIVPYITDCIEDSNEKVNIEAFNLMKFIEKTTGEDFKNYLDIDN